MVAAPLRARAPVPAPEEKSTWQDELWRLERLYRESGQFLCEESKEGPRVIRLAHHCTDPDWEAVNWVPNGLCLEIEVPLSYPESLVPLPELRVLGPPDLPERFVRIVPLLFAESVAKAPANIPAVYRALQYVDRHLTLLWLKLRAKERGEEMPMPAAEQSRLAAAGGPIKAESGAAAGGGGSWTAAEQERLEAAMAEFRSEPDVKQRWNSVALRVGGGKTARDCAERYRTCRAAALSREPVETPVPFAPANFLPVDRGASLPPAPAVAAAAAVAAPAMSAAEVRRLGVEVRLLGLVLEGFTTLLPAALRLQVVCSRCKKPTDVESKGNGTDVRSLEAACPTCKTQLGVSVAPVICHGGCAAIAYVSGSSCHPVQLLRSDLEAVCGECTAAAVIRNAGPGLRKRANCTACFARSNITIEGADMIGTGVAQWRQIAQEQGEQQNARRQLQDARRQERDLGIRVGQPLPYQGACKHFHKSYKWLRFPCCGRAFPCDECHDENMDHPYEWATRILCGYCSYEQLASKDKCMNCGAATTRSRTAYWEGGEGCRNRTLMSKSDSHKYRGMGKTVSAKSAAK